MAEQHGLHTALIVHGAEPSGRSCPVVVGLAQANGKLNIALRVGEDSETVYLEPNDAARLIVNLRKAIAAEYHYSWPSQPPFTRNASADQANSGRPVSTRSRSA
ncbi:hypothetical protein [Haloechinothrix salitolerans]|uniref:Uncharacterized protein n=1 Tax=Haloechinothrix salitolerans TaxID=926830 RepID=A0ABW2BSQ3_9PSEU